MNTKVITEGWDSIDTDLLIYPVNEKIPGEEEPGSDNSNFLEKLAAELQESGEWKPSRGSSLLLIHPLGCKAKRVGLIGLGPAGAEFDRGSFRTAVMNLVRSMQSVPLKRITAHISRFADQATAGRMLCEGIFLGAFDPGVHKSSRVSTGPLEKLALVSSLKKKETDRILRESEIISSAVNLARELSNEPGNLLYPEAFIRRTREAVSGTGLEIRVLEERELREKGFGCLLAVAKGSCRKPFLCVIEHNPGGDHSEPPIVLVGKGVTFDSGGISIKPSASMEEMRADKSGACSVLGTLLAVSKLNLKARVLGIMPLVENLPGGNAQRPGDVVRAYNGTTVEVINTDAEGRLILADAMSWAVEQFRPSALVDIATLTGACAVALGHHRAGLFSNNQGLCSQLFAAAETGGEKLWRLPLDEEYRESLESRIADIKNCGDRWGGAITAAKFLQSFVGETPWCHIDMAGTDFFQSGINKGTPPGFGVRTMVEFVRLNSSRNPRQAGKADPGKTN